MFSREHTSSKVFFIGAQQLFSDVFTDFATTFTQISGFKNKFAFSDYSSTRLAAARWQDSMSRGEKS